ncbi:MAG: Rrf2 family transcriptional regulator, partial [Chloroflexi bacterium]|nr:Rrf2 family transcriptional regulator [Chloroflexota bacterium]
GLVRSTRGPTGGHTLARPPQEITLDEIITALEGAKSFVSCLIDEQTCQLGVNCAILHVWQEMESASLRVLRAVTLAELAAKQAQRLEVEMYYI